MNALMRKEMFLSASVLSYFFIGFAVMTFLPGYPILCGAFFITLGIFQSFQSAREANDIVYSALLPIAKQDVVKGKFQFSVMIQMAGFLVMAIITIVRMTVLANAEVYQHNALMTANLFFLGMVLLVFGLFNLIFIGGFFRTAFKFSPFVVYIITAFAAIGIAEALHYIPGLEMVNSFGFDNIGLQAILLLCGAVLYLVLTYVSYKRSCAVFETIDL